MVKPRVLIFSLAYLPWVSGAEIAVKEIADRLDGYFDFDLITLRFDKNNLTREKINNIDVFRVNGSKIFFPIKAVFLACKLHKKNNYQILWSIMAAYAGLGALFFKFLCPKVSLLLTLQEGDSEKHILKRVGIFYPLWRQIFKKADYIQVISNYLANFAKKYGAECPVEVVPNGVDLNKIKNQKSNLKNRNQNSNIKTIITTSRLVYKNGVDILIRAVALLKAKNHKSSSRAQAEGLKAVIVGDGPDRSKLEKLAIDLGVADKVEFIGQVNPDEIPNYLSQADIFIRPSRSEGLGNSFLEAMAAGLPVIGTPVGGIPDFLKDYETGLFCEVDNPDDLADKIIRIFDDNDLYRKLSDNGRKLVESKYSWDPIAFRMSGIFKLLATLAVERSSLQSTVNYKLKTRKLLLATGIYPPEIGGPATYAVLLERKLPERGIDVSVLPFKVVRKWPIGLRHFFYFIKSFSIGKRCDFILAQDTISVGLPSMLAAKILGKKFLIRVPGDYVWEQSTQRFGVKDSIDEFQIKKYGWRVELLRSVQKFVVNNADVVITPSKYFQRLVSGWVTSPSRVEVIYNGVDLDIKNKISKIKYTDQKSKIIVSAGRLVAWKGFDFLIELMQDLPDWKLVIIGDGPEKENLKFKIKNLKLEDRILLLGQVPRDELMQRMAEANIFVLNTSFESFSFQVVEAMSLGLPVITTNIGNLSEIIDNGENGFLLEPNNRRQFLETINKIDSDDNLRQKISKGAQVKAQNFSIKNTVESLVSILNRIG